MLSAAPLGGDHPAGVSHAVGTTVFVLIVVAVVALLASAASPRWRPTVFRALGLLVTSLVAIYLVGRGIAEFWVVDYSNPASFRHAWGGPSLAGVFAVHSGPAAAVLVASLVWLYRRRLRRQRELAGLAATSRHQGSWPAP